MANQRILAGAAATLTFTNLDADGLAADAIGAMTVGVTRADGTVVIAAGGATTHGATGVYTKALTAAQTASLDLFTATWTDAGAGARTSDHEIVGGYVFSIDEAKAFETLSAISNTLIIAKRAEVEDELERIRNAAFVPRYARLTLNGTGDREIVTGLSWVRRLRTCKLLSSTGSSSSSSFTATQLAACQVTEDGRIRRGDGDVFDYGVANVIVEIEHGFTDWGSDLKTAALTRLRERLNKADSGIPDRAKSYQSQDGYSYDIAEAGADSTGNPYVDAVYARYPHSNDGQQVASRMLQFRPQYGGVFRGWPVSQ